MSRSNHQPWILLDPALVAAAGWLAYLLRWERMDLSTDYLVAIILGAALAPIAFYASGTYSRHGISSRGAVGLSVLGGAVLLALALTALSVATKTSAEYSRIWMLCWAGLACIGLLAARRLMHVVLKSDTAGESQRRRRILLCDPAARAEAFCRQYANSTPATGIHAILRVSDNSELRFSDSSTAPSLPYPELIENDWRNYLIKNGHSYDELWLLGDRNDNDDLLPSILRLTSTPVRYVFEPATTALLQHPLEFINGVASVELHASPLDRQGRVVKAIMDRGIAALALLLGSPVLLLLALGVFLESGGPVLFRQQRHGLNGEVFSMFKFRTMVPGSDDGVQARASDPRVTRVGKVLRRYSLDELPQLLNVLLGHMSLVGPRPHPMDLNHRFMHEVDALMQRHKVKPGITGWAQVNGQRGETATAQRMAARIADDIYYIEHWSLWLDVKILIVTATKGWTGENAY